MGLFKKLAMLAGLFVVAAPAVIATPAAAQHDPGRARHPASVSIDAHIDVAKGTLQTHVKYTAAYIVWKNGRHSTPGSKIRTLTIEINGVARKVVTVNPPAATGDTTITLPLSSLSSAERNNGFAVQAKVYTRFSNNPRAHNRPAAVSNVVAISPSIPTGVAKPSSDKVVAFGGSKVVKDEVVVGLKLDQSAPEQRIREIAAQTQGVIVGSVADTATYQLRYNVGNLGQLEAKRVQLAALPGVSFATHNVVSEATSAIANDQKYYAESSTPWDDASPTERNWGLKYIKAPAAWDTSTGKEGTRIGVIDRGFDTTHEDLKANLLPPTGFTTKTNTNTHGNETAGIICASGNNGIGITGVNWRCSLGMYTHDSVDRYMMPLEAQQLMKEAASDNMRIVNMSLQWVDTNSCVNPTAESVQLASEVDDTIAQAILWAKNHDKDVLWVFSAGNECRDVKYAAPASLASHPIFKANTLAVAGIKQNGQLRGDSNRGSGISVAAPGDNIYTTQGVSCPNGVCHSDYGSDGGTSMAAPFVTGVAGLVVSAHPDFTAEQIRQCIVDGATIPVAGGTYTFKVIDAARAVACKPPKSDPCALHGDAPTCESTNPAITLSSTNTSDTSSCTFSLNINWGDGKTEVVSIKGSSTIGLTQYATHTYQQPNTYNIGVTSSVTTGFCTISNASYTFTLLSKPSS